MPVLSPTFGDPCLWREAPNAMVAHADVGIRNQASLQEAQGETLKATSADLPWSVDSQPQSLPDVEASTDQT